MFLKRVESFVFPTGLTISDYRRDGYQIIMKFLISMTNLNIGHVSLFNDISTSVGYLTPTPFLLA